MPNNETTYGSGGSSRKMTKYKIFTSLIKDDILEMGDGSRWRVLDTPSSLSRIAWAENIGMGRLPRPLTNELTRIKSAPLALRMYLAVLDDNVDSLVRPEWSLRQEIVLYRPIKPQNEDGAI